MAEPIDLEKHDYPAYRLPFVRKVAWHSPAWEPWATTDANYWALDLAGMSDSEAWRAGRHAALAAMSYTARSHFRAPHMLETIVQDMIVQPNPHAMHNRMGRGAFFHTYDQMVVATAPLLHQFSAAVNSNNNVALRTLERMIEAARVAGPKPRARRGGRPSS